MIWTPVYIGVWWIVWERYLRREEDPYPSLPACKQDSPAANAEAQMCHSCRHVPAGEDLHFSACGYPFGLVRRSDEANEYVHGATIALRHTHKRIHHSMARVRVVVMHSRMDVQMHGET